MQEKQNSRKQTAPRNRSSGVMVSFLFWTHSNVVNSHPHGPMVIDLFCGDRLGLVSQKNAQQQQQTLVAINHAYRKTEETVRECRQKSE